MGAGGPDPPGKSQVAMFPKKFFTMLYGEKLNSVTHKLYYGIRGTMEK